MNTNRIGDIAEHKAIVWLMEQGYEVFHNTGCSGPIDIVAVDISTNTTYYIDVKKCTEYVKEDGSISLGVGKKTETQQKLQVRFLLYRESTDSFIFQEDAITA